MLSPILNPFRALVNRDHLQDLYQARLHSKNSKPDAVLLSDHEDKIIQFLTSINQYTNSQGEVTSIARENQRGLDAILKLGVFEKHFPFPGSKKYQQSLKLIKDGLENEPNTWFTLILWNDLRLLGRVITSDEEYTEISRSWVDEWGLIRVVRAEFEKLGMDDQQSYRAETILKLLIQQQNWVFSAQDMSAIGLIKTWFAEPEIRSFLNINRYRDKLWFNKEAFNEMMWWMMTIALIRLSADPTISLTELVERLFDAYEQIEKILEAEAASEYQVEKLLEGLK
jgi:hypothetical protein